MNNPFDDPVGPSSRPPYQQGGAPYSPVTRPQGTIHKLSSVSFTYIFLFTRFFRFLYKTHCLYPFLHEQLIHFFMHDTFVQAHGEEVYQLFNR